MFLFQHLPSSLLLFLFDRGIDKLYLFFCSYSFSCFFVQSSPPHGRATFKSVYRSFFCISCGQLDCTFRSIRSITTFSFVSTIFIHGNTATEIRTAFHRNTSTIRTSALHFVVVSCVCVCIITSCIIKYTRRSAYVTYVASPAHAMAIKIDSLWSNLWI